MIELVEGALESVIVPVGLPVAKNSVANRVVADLVGQQIRDCHFKDIASLPDLHRPAEGPEEARPEVFAVHSRRRAPFYFA